MRALLGILTISVTSSWALPVSQVRLEGLSRTRAQVVWRELAVKGGTEADSLQITRDADRLERLGIFAGIEWHLDSAGTLTWRFQELPWILPVPNGRMSDADGLSLGGGFKSPNFLGEAVSLEVLGLLGGVTEWQVAGSGGWIAGLPIGWDAFTNRSEREAPFVGGHETSVRNQMLLRYPNDAPLRLELGGGLAWVREENRTLSVSPDGRDWIPSFLVGGLWDSRDRLGLTRKGIFQELLAERMGGPLGGSLDGWMLTSDTRTWLPLNRTWGLHAANLLEWQTGTVNAWRGFVVGGPNSARFLPAAQLQGRSEDLASLEMRWTAVEPHPVTVLGQPLYWGLQALAGVEAAAAWSTTWPEDFRMGPVAGLDLLVPYLGRIRLTGGWSSCEGGVVALGVGLEEKTVASRWKGR